ncbi:pectin lyase fold/virulence factor [Hypoxylon crocopeplum]|nr:pectin lyase fold/virulence factor [Hypoxylon crocopeplum]
MRASRLVIGAGWLLNHFASLALGATSTTTTSSAAAATVAVNLDGTAQFTSIGDAIFYAQKHTIATVSVAAGTYKEAVVINATAAVTIVGATSFPDDYTRNQVIISTAGIPLTINTNSVKGITWRNINFVTTNTSTTAWAVSLRGTKNAFYGCQIISAGNQAFYSTLGITLIANSYVEAATQTFAGYLGLYVFNSTVTATAATNGIILFNKGLSTTNSTVVFDSSTITQKILPLKERASIGVYLAAPNGNYAQGVWKNTYMSSLIIPQGVYNYPSTSIGNFFGEFNNRGPGSFLLNVCARIGYDHLLDSSQLAPFTIGAVFANSFPPYATSDLSWIDPTVLVAINAADASSASATQSSPTVSCPTTSTSPTTSATATATGTCAPPTSASQPPLGAVVVDPTNLIVGAFLNLTAALASLPLDSSCQTIYLAAGTYIEQISINRPGRTVIVGFTLESPGRGYAGNQVTIAYCRGLSVAPLPVGHSNAETAVISTASASANVSFYNINFINTDNLDGATASYVTLAASVYGNHIAFYGCAFVGWQDTLLTGQRNGYQYYESSYIDGAIDFIWGYSAAYFRGCTIAAKRRSSAITAQSRQDASSIGIFVFDQSLVTAAVGFESATRNGVYLGRPYSAYARVVFKDSYLDAAVRPAGWKIWSDSDPRIDNVVFAEFNNTGLGNWENNAAARVGFGHATLLTSDEYPLSSVLDTTAWIDLRNFDSAIAPTALVAPNININALSICSAAQTSTTGGLTTVPTTTTTTVGVVTQSTTATVTVGSNTVTPSPVVTTQLSIPTARVTSTVTVTPDPLSTRTSFTTVTTTVVVTSTVAPQTTTQVVSQTTSRTITSMGPGSTVSSTSTVVVTRTITPAAITVTGTVATTTLAGPTVTTTGRPVTKTVVILVIVRKTVVTTTTIGRWRAKRTDNPEIQARAVSTVGSTTTTVTQTVTSSAAGAVTLAPSTRTVTSVTTSTSTVTTTPNIRQTRMTITLTSTSTVSSTVTVAAASATVTSTTTISRDVTVTSPGPVQTSTVLTTVTIQFRLPPSTTTSSMTLTTTDPTVTSSVPGPTISSRTTETSTQVVTSTVTEYRRGGPYNPWY